MSELPISEGPVPRRSRAIKALIRNMRASTSGWTEAEASKFLVKQYGYGLRKRTAVGILRELVELGVLYIEGYRGGFPIYYVKKE